MKTKYINSQYYEAIHIGNWLYIFFPTTNLTNQILLSISLSYFALNKDSRFIDYLNQIHTTKYNAVKYYWLTVYSIISNDEININKYYQEFKLNQNNIPRYYTYKYYDDVLNLLMSIHSNQIYNDDSESRVIEGTITNPRILQYIKRFKE